MCTSEYLAGVLAKFRRKYPAGTGWKTFVITPDLEGRPRAIGFLPAYLKEKRPAWIVKRTLIPAGRNRTRFWDNNGVDLPPAKVKSKLVPLNWYGELNISVDGKPVTYLSLPMLNQHAWGALVLIAYKDIGVVERLHNAANRWLAGKGEKIEQISVVNCGGVISHIPRPQVGWDSLILADAVADEIRLNLEGFFKAGPRYKDLGLPHKRGFLLAGPPGNGKTLIAKIIASDTSRHFTWFSLNSEISDSDIGLAFAHAAQYAPSVLLFEDLDRMVTSQTASMSYLLNRLDGMSVKEGVLVLATSNAPEKLDPALLHRPSRFDRVWNIGLPDPAQRLELLRRKGGHWLSDKTLAHAAAETKGFSMAYTQELVTNAMLLAVNSGGELQDSHLLTSLAQLKQQFTATAAKDGLSRQLRGAPTVGFSA